MNRYPIDEDVVEKAVYEFSHCGDDIEDSDDLDELLAEVQAAALNNLSDYHREAANGSDRIDAWGETRSENLGKYVFLGPLDSIWERLFERAGIDVYSVKQTLLNVHRLQAKEYGANVDKRALLVSKPKAWENGQSAFRGDLQRLLRKGLTPAEAVDLLFTEYEPHTISKSFQAEKRGVRQQAVSKNVKQAKEKLHERQTRHLAHLNKHSSE